MCCADWMWREVGRLLYKISSLGWVMPRELSHLIALYDFILLHNNLDGLAI